MIISKARFSIGKKMQIRLIIFCLNYHGKIQEKSKNKVPPKISIYINMFFLSFHYIPPNHLLLHFSPVSLVISLSLSLSLSHTHTLSPLSLSLSLSLFLSEELQSNKYYTSRAIGVTSEVGLTTDSDLAVRTCG